MLSRDSFINQALKLTLEERFLIIETLIQSLDRPDKNIDAIWADEAEKRLKAYREGKLKGIPIEDVLGQID